MQEHAEYTQTTASHSQPATPVTGGKRMELAATPACNTSHRKEEDGAGCEKGQARKGHRSFRNHVVFALDQHWRKQDQPKHGLYTYSNL